MKKHVNEVAFRGASSLPNDIKKLQKPVELFHHFFNAEVIALIADESNRAAIVEDINTRFRTTPDEIRHFIAILIYMSVVKCPNIEFCWGPFGLPAIQNTMPIRRFYDIKKYLSFQDTSQRKKKGEQGYDPIFRIRNLANLLNSTFDSIPKTTQVNMLPAHKEWM